MLRIDHLFTEIDIGKFWFVCLFSCLFLKLNFKAIVSDCFKKYMINSGVKFLIDKKFADDAHRQKEIIDFHGGVDYF